MILKTLILKNFRAYRGIVRIPISENLTAFIGRNDVGKSSILDALDIFLNSPKIEKEDNCVHSEDNETRIGCVFSGLPSSLILDESSPTDLAAEYLLNAEGDLEVHFAFDCNLKTPKLKVLAIAQHPSASGCSELLLMKNANLKTELSKLDVDQKTVDQRSNPAIRKAIWGAQTDLMLCDEEIELNKEGDAKRIWEQLQKYLPVFALFKSDKASTDDDSEVQDPLKAAVKQALGGLRTELGNIEGKVRDEALMVAKRTLGKLKELDSKLASELSPKFKTDPKWDSIFKLTLDTDDQIPVNKRGSGVRRLILLSFFRAEAERKRFEEEKTSVIYAIEEPETSQHPYNQKLLVKSLKELAGTEGTQVIISTHVPGLAELVPLEGIRYIRKSENNARSIELSDNEVYERIAEELGVLPDNRVSVFVCVEGPNDVAFLRHISRILPLQNNTIPDLLSGPEVALLPLGGSTLRNWVDEHYLRGLNKPEVHLYDKGHEEPPKYQRASETINARGDGSVSFITQKREIENYLHPDAISNALSVRIQVDDDMDVPLAVARSLHEKEPSAIPWDEVADDKKEKKKSRAKHRLNAEAAARMTVPMLDERGATKEIQGWFEAIIERIE